MKFSQAALCILASATLPSCTQAVLYGDEQYLDVPGGKFWAFYSGGVAIVDPETCNIEKKITQDHEGKDLPGGWSDGVYMQYDGSSGLEGYVMINSRINSENAQGDPVSSVIALSSTERKVVSTIEVGHRVVHSYGVHTHNQFWSHSDGNGHFYVIDLKDLSEHSAKVKVHDELPFHGKLLWDEDGTLGNRGFATATGEQFLFEVDLKDAELTGQFDYSSFLESKDECQGLHAIAYSAKNMHVYTECSGGGGILEFDVSNGEIDFVHQHRSATGALYELPDGSYVVAANKGKNKLHVFKPNDSGEKSSTQYDVHIPGNPSTPSFFPVDSDDDEADFIACMPLTENANMNQRDSSGPVCDFWTGCSDPSTASDVSNGVCLHELAESKAAGPLTLKRVTEVVSGDDAVLCARCADESNFDNGSCVCTPDCGSCDDNKDIDTTQAGGVACVDLKKVVNGGLTEGTQIFNAGAVKQGGGYGGSPECSFGRTYRSHKRGTKYDASVANYPVNSIQIVNMETQKKQCEVALDGSPARVVYVPSKPVEVAESGAVHNLGMVSIFLAGFVASILF